MTDEKLGKNWEQKRYEDTLTQVYTSQDEQETIFKAVRLRDYQDKEEVRLCIAKDDRLVKALQTPLSKLGEKINEVINYGVVVSYVDRASLIKEVYRLYQGIPVIDKVEGLGWQYSADGEVKAFAGSEFIGIDGKDKVADIEAGLPIKKGMDNMETINSYMNKNVVREIVMLYNLTAPVAGMLKQCFILSLHGKSSTGKTTLAKLAASQTCSPEYDRLCKTLNTTDNASEKGLEGIKGLGVLLDDTSLTNKGFDWDRFLYRLSTGRTKERLNRDCQVLEARRFYSTIVLTTEMSILSKVDPNREGNNGRIIEIPVKEGIAFDDDVECRGMELYYRKNYGNALPTLVKKIIGLGCAEVKDMVYSEELDLRKAYAEQDVVVKRHFLEIAALRVTARMANQYLGYQFHIEDITAFLIENIAVSLIDTREMQPADRVYTVLYPELVNVAGVSKEIDGKVYRYIEGKVFKNLVDTHCKGISCKEAKNILWERNLLLKIGNTFSIVKNVGNGEELRGYWLICEGEK